MSKEIDEKKKNEEGTYQIIQEDATMAAMGYTNPTEVQVEKPQPKE